MNNNSTLQIGYFFPTAIGVSIDLLSSEHLDDIQIACNKIYETNINSNNDNWLCGELSPFNTMGTHNISIDKNFETLNNFVSLKVKEFALHHSDAGEYVCEESWMNFYKDGQYQEPHKHSAPNVYSAVYFPLATEDSGFFVAQSPHNHVVIESTLFGPNILTDEKRWYQPQSNMLLIFKSSLSHYVMPNRSKDAKRISIAYNFKLA